MAVTLEVNGDRCSLKRDGKCSHFEDGLLEDMFQFDQNHAMPDGVKFIRHCGGLVTIVYQQQPRIRRIRWIHNNSPATEGKGVIYRTVNLSFPYVLSCVTFCQKRWALLGDWTELYFMTKPAYRSTDKLLYPSLLNVSAVNEGFQERAWVCTQYYRSKRRTWVGQLHDYLEHLWNGGFNLSSEAHEGDSWFSRTSRQVDDVSTVERWEEWSSQDPGRALRVKWLSSPFTIEDVIRQSQYHAQPLRTPLEVRMASLLRASK